MTTPSNAPSLGIAFLGRDTLSLQTLIEANAVDVRVAFAEADRAERFDLKAICHEYDVTFELWDPGRSYSDLVSERCDFAVVSEFPILPQVFIGLFRLGALNIHPASIYDAPGRYPFPQLVESGIEASAVMLHKITETVDCGKVLDEEPYLMGADFDYRDWLERVNHSRHRLLTRYFNRSTDEICTGMSQTGPARPTQAATVTGRSPCRPFSKSSAESLDRIVRINRFAGGTTVCDARGEQFTVYGGRKVSRDTAMKSVAAMEAGTCHDWPIECDDGSQFLVDWWEGEVPHLPVKEQ